jgi:hypothetical protein
MITLDALLVFLGAVSLPIIYFFIVRRWVEAEYRQTYPPTVTNKSGSAGTREFEKAA